MVELLSANTHLYFTQKESRVFTRYGGGSVRSGCLVGTISRSEFVFRYTQVEDSGQIHGGRSICEVQCSAQAGIRKLSCAKPREP
jgi:hypothetical protein